MPVLAGGQPGFAARKDECSPRSGQRKVRLDGNPIRQSKSADHFRYAATLTCSRQGKCTIDGGIRFHRYALSLNGRRGEAACRSGRFRKDEREGMARCDHRVTINQVTPQSQGCAECLADGNWWVHLRVCRSCGHVGCCDDSPNRHASAHFAATRHPIIEGYDPPEGWSWPGRKAHHVRNQGFETGSVT